MTNTMASRIFSTEEVVSFLFFLMEDMETEFDIPMSLLQNVAMRNLNT